MTCRVCQHPHREAIEAALARGDSYRQVMGRYGALHLRALSWHQNRCMTPEPAGDELRAVLDRIAAAFTGEAVFPDDLPDPLEPDYSKTFPEADLEDFPDFDFLELPEPDLEPFDFPELEPVDFGELFEAAEGKETVRVAGGVSRCPRLSSK